MTRQVILQIDVTLDGFIAGPAGESDWVHADAEMNQDAYDLLDRVDTVLLGRVAYQDFVAYWPNADTNAPTIESKIADRLNHATKIVFSRTLQTVAWGKWDNARLIKGNIAQEMTAMKTQPGKDLILYAGADIASAFMQHGLIDEYRLRVHPIIVGGGKPLFQNIKDRFNLSLVEAKSYKNGAVLLHYQAANK